MKQVLRIENRKLDNRLTSAVRTILEQRPDSTPPHNTFSDLVEYLFLVWTPGRLTNHKHLEVRLTLIRTPDTDLLLVTRDGFSSTGQPVHLTNSITMADLPRLQHTSGCGQSREWGQRSRDSELLLCKVFKGNHIEVKSREM